MTQNASSILTRRQLLAGAAAAAAMMLLPQGARATDTAPKHRYSIAAADWMLLKRQKPGALQLAHDCTLDGIEVDIGPLGTRPDFENNLLKDEFRQPYLETAKKLDLEISSLAMSAFYGQPFADHPGAERFLQEWIDLMPKLGTKVGFLPIISKSDLATDAAARGKLAALFKTVTGRAEQAGLVLGLNTPLDADANKRLLDEIGSAAVRISYNFGEAVDAGRDVERDLRALGRDRIAEIIPTLSDGKWLENDDRTDMPKLKGVLDDIGWSGWLVLQRSRVKGKGVKENFSANAKYLKSVFQG